MTLDRIVICMFGVPIAGIAGLHPVSAWQIFRRDSEEVAFSGLDNKLAFPALYDFATQGIVEESVLKAVDEYSGELVKRIMEFRAPTNIGGF